jgi:hypothetical protein
MRQRYVHEHAVVHREVKPGQPSGTTVQRFPCSSNISSGRIP